VHRVFVRYLFLVLAVWLAAPAMAGGLYSGEVPVNSQSEGDRNEGLKAALAQVFTKVGGDASVLARPDIAKAVAGASRYVQQYQFTQDVATSHLMLSAQFDREAIDQLLGSAGAKSGDAAPAVVDTKPQSYRVWVRGVGSADAYARLMGTLSRNELVRGVQAEQARGDGVELKIDTVGPLQRVLDSLGNGPIRVANAKPPVDGVDALLDMQP
jgi:hypothetical protein